MAALCHAQTTPDSNQTSDSTDHHVPVVPAVVVTGTQPGATAFQTPASISVVSGQALEDAHLDTLGQVAQRLPNTSVTSYTQTNPIIMIRGLGIDTDESNSAAIPVLLDGVPIFGLAVGQLFDLDQMQLLRGPHSLDGPSAIGGMILLQSRDPDRAAGGNLALDYGSHGRERATLSGDLPLSDSTGLRIAVGGEHGDGYTDNTTLGRDNTAGWNSTFAHLKLLHRDEAGGEWRFGLYQMNSRGGNDYFAMPGLAREHQSGASDTGTNKTEFTLLSGSYNREFSGGTKLAVNLGANRTQWNYWLPQSLFDARSGFDMVTRQFSAEARLSGQQGSIDWMVGLFDQQTKREAPYLYDMSPYYRSSTHATLESNSAATFGQVGWRFAPAWRIAAGVRVEYDRSRLDWRGDQGGLYDSTGDGIPDTPFNSTEFVQGARLNHTAVLARLTLEYQPNERNYGWLTLARGYEPPGFNTYASKADQAGQPYNAAIANYIELGYRLRGVDDAWELGATLFDTFLHDQQNVVTSNGQTVTTNAQRSHSRGAELSGKWRPSRQLEFNAFVGLIDAKYDDYVLNGVSYAGRQFAMTPRQSVGLAVSWHPTAQWDMGVGVVRQGATNLFPNSNVGNHPYTLVDAHITYRVRQWSIGVYGQNLGNAHYFTRAVNNGFVVAGNPRTAGVRVSMDF